MRLAEFIEKESVAIVAEWTEFALTCMPDASVAERRDHVAAMLKTIAHDLDTPQTGRDQEEKGKGNQDVHPECDTAASSHGVDRATSGFTPNDMLAEFRALRASVLRLWLKKQATFDRTAMEDVTRFNEAIDQALAESVARYALHVDKSRDLFLGILCHDLRNPLGAILMATSLILRDSGPDWPHRRIASRILTSGARMDAIIHDLVDLTRSRLGGGIAVAPAPMDLGTACQQAVDEITAFHPGCAVSLGASGDLTGSWDAGRIGQVLSNLLGNAQQHGAAGRPVDVTVRGEADCVVVAVRNAGSPIPKGRMREMFDPFRQLAPEGTAGNLRSMGLGLYITQQIVEAHGGTVGVDSDEDATTFTVVLPRHAPVSTRRPATPQLKRA